MANARLLGTSLADSVTLSATSEAQAVANLQDVDVQKTWRSSDLTQQVISGDLGSSQTINALVLANVNGVTAEYLIQLSDDNFTTINYSASFSAFSSNTAYNMAVHWFNDTGGGELVDSGGDSLVDGGGDSLIAGTYSVPPSGRYFRLTVIDPSNADGYMEIGRLKIGQYFDAPNSKNIAIGPSLRYVPRSQLVRTRGGGMRAENRTRAAQINIVYEFAHQSDSYAIGSDSFAEFLEEIGYESDVFVTVFPEDGDDRERRFSVLGRIINNPALDTNFIEGGTTLTAYQRIPLTILEAL